MQSKSLAQRYFRHWKARGPCSLKFRRLPCVYPAVRRRAAVRLAEKRRLGPFSRDDAPHDPRIREKAIAAMLRAGHELAHARFILEAATQDDIADWLAEAESADGKDEGINTPW